MSNGSRSKINKIYHMLGRLLSRTLFGMTITVGGQYKDAETTLELAHLYSKAKKNIKIVSGVLKESVFQSPAVKKELIKAHAKGAKIEVITGPNADKKSITFLESLEATVHMLDGWPVEHISIVDGKHLRTELPHAPDDINCTQFVNYYSNYAGLNEIAFSNLIPQPQAGE